MTLTREYCQKSNEILEVYLAPGGDKSSQVKKLMEKAKEFAKRIRTGQISEEDAFQALKITIWKTLEYPMVVTSLNRNTWEEIITPVINVTLPKMGIVLPFPRELVYTSKECQGMNIHHSLYWQITLQIIILNKHFVWDTITGRLLLIKWKGLVQSIGLEGNSELWPWEIIQECAI